MFGGGLSTHSLPLYSQSMMLPYDVPVPQPYPSPFPVPQPYLQTVTQHIDVPMQHTIQPVICPTPYGVPVPQPVPVPVPVDRPCAVPVPQPVPYPVDRPYAVPFPVHVSVPQPVAVPQPVFLKEQIPVPVPVPFPVAVPVQAPQVNYAPPSYRQVEYIIEEPVRIIRRRRHRRRCRSYCSAPPAPLPPIIIPIPIQAPAVVQQQPQQYQVTEYVQDIYPPAQVFTEQVPVGYRINSSVIQQPDLIQNQQTSFNCQPGVVVPSASYVSPVRVQQQLVQQLPNGQLVQRPLRVGGGGVQNVILQQPGISSSNSATLFSTPSFGT